MSAGVRNAAIVGAAAGIGFAYLCAWLDAQVAPRAIQASLGGWIVLCAVVGGCAGLVVGWVFFR